MVLAKQAATAALLLYFSGARAQDTTTGSPTTSSPPTTCTAALTPSYAPPAVAEGWRAQLVATGLSRPRGMKFDSNGNLLVVESRVGITHLTFDNKSGGCLTVGRRRTLVADRALNHGIELSADGRTLYASTAENVYSWAYDPDEVTVSDQRTLVSNMSPRGHVTRTLLLSQREPGLLLVSQGSVGNVDPLATDPDTGISQIRAFNLTNLTDASQPYVYARDGFLVGRGLRNSVGVAEHPVTGGIWSVENSADDISRLGRDIHEDNPGEELNYHGTLNITALLNANFGYPYCFALWNTTDFPERGDMGVGDQFVIDLDEADIPSSVTDEACQRDYVRPRLTFRAHMAPLDIKFLPGDGSRAFVSFHGSWNRDQPAGYKVSALFFDPASGQPTDPPDSASAAVDIFFNPDLSACPSACLRPAGLAFDPDADARLFVSSDATGEIWALQRAVGEDPAPKTTWSGTVDTPTGGGAAGPTTSDSAAPGLRAGGRMEGWVAVGLTMAAAAVGGVFMTGI